MCVLHIRRYCCCTWHETIRIFFICETDERIYYQDCFLYQYVIETKRLFVSSLLLLSWNYIVLFVLPGFISTHPVSVLIPYPRETHIMSSSYVVKRTAVRQRKTKNKTKIANSSVKQLTCQRTGYENTTTLLIARHMITRYTADSILLWLGSGVTKQALYSFAPPSPRHYNSRLPFLSREDCMQPYIPSSTRVLLIAPIHAANALSVLGPFIFWPKKVKISPHGGIRTRYRRYYTNGG